MDFQRRGKPMPHCQNCGIKWTWSDMITGALKGKMPCPNCQKDQYVLRGSNYLAAFLATFPLVLLYSYLMTNFGFSWPLAIGAFIVFMAFGTLAGPFFYKLSNTKNRN